MRFAPHIKHILQTKGGWHAMERAGQVLWRFSVGRRQFERMLETLEQDWDTQLRITFCVAASLLRRHAELIRRLEALGHPIAAHGYYHSRMDILDFQQQSDILENSHQAFQRAGVDIDGFRCPYLNYNHDTVEALQVSPYRWTSQHLVFWQNGFSPHLRRLFTLYTTSMAQNHLSLPSQVGRVIEIPITAPDDEMLVERFRVRDQGEMRETWLKIFEQTLKRGEIFHLLFHPERFFFVKEALSDTLSEVRSCPQPVWLATLSELAQWWSERSAAHWRIDCAGGSSPGTAMAWIRLPERGSVMLSGQGPGRGQALLDNYRPQQPSSRRGDRSGFDLGGYHRLPVVGLSPRSPQPLESFLRDQGFLVARTDAAREIQNDVAQDIGAAARAPEEFALYLDRPGDFEESDHLSLLEEIEAAPPLLRLWRWPDGAAAAATVSSDVDSITLRDFVERAFHF